jgi:hypothetical protein
MRTPIDLSLNTITDSRVRRAYEYWNSARRGRAMPTRSDMDPIDLHFCLGWICLISVTYEPVRRFQFRLDGSKIVQLTGVDLTGRFIEEIEPEDYRKLATMIYGRVADTRSPVFIGNMEDWLERGFYMESVALPLSENGVDVTGIMEVICPAKALLPGEVGTYLDRSSPQQCVGGETPAFTPELSHARLD